MRHFLLIVASGSILFASAVDISAEVPVGAESKRSPALPKLNVRVKAHVDSMKESLTNQGDGFEDVGARWGKLFDFRRVERLDSIPWVQQLFLMTLPENEPDPTAAWAMGMNYVQFTRAFANRITPEHYLKALAAYVESDNEIVSDRALEMLNNSGALLPNSSRSLDSRARGEFEWVADYLKTNKPIESHPKLLRAIYEQQPEAALHTIAKATLDQKTERQIDRQQAELSSMRILAEFKDDAKASAELDKKIIDRLNEMKKDPNWCVRAYVAAVTPDIQWLDDKSQFQELTKDSNPIVAEIAKRTFSERKEPEQK